MIESQINTTEQVQDSVQYQSVKDRYVQFFEQAIKIVKECRHETMTSQAELAVELGVDRRKIMALENGERDMELLVKIADHYDIELTFKT